MTEGTAGARVDDSNRLPWLEAVEEEERPGGVPVAKLIAVILISLAAISIAVGGFYWLRNRDEGGRGEIIAAPEGDYKVKPADPGGMKVEGEGETAFAASEGVEPAGRLNTNVVPEAPVDRPQRAPTATQPSQVAAPPGPASGQPAPRPASDATIQLGAFGSQARATTAWTALSGRFRYLAPLSHWVVPVEIDGRTLYRLRASGADAAGICRRLKIAGEDCEIVG